MKKKKGFTLLEKTKHEISSHQRIKPKVVKRGYRYIPLEIINSLTGFTLVELLMVVIIIGVLVTIALPNFLKAQERSKGGKAKFNLGAIRSSQSWYRANNDSYTSVITNLSDYGLPLPPIIGDQDWSYAVTTATPDSLLVSAYRLKGPYSGAAITIDHDGAITKTAASAPW